MYGGVDGPDSRWAGAIGNFPLQLVLWALGER